MGIGTLRRYHKAPTPAGASKGAPVVASGLTEEELAEKARLKAEKKAAKKQAKADAKSAEGTGNGEGTDGEQTGEDVPTGTDTPEATTEPAAADAGAEPATVSAEDATPKHGDLDMPNRGSSKQLWIAYAEADTGGTPDGFAEFTRDQIADLYMGMRD